MTPYITIFQALNDAEIRYIVVGGIAVNLHGVERATADVDLVVYLERENLLRFAKVMTSLGYRPKVPVKAEAFADEELREQWITEKHMLVFSFINLKEPLELIDVLVRHPLPFESMYKNRVQQKALGTIIPIAGLEDLIELKRAAGRPKDLFDLGLLEALLEQTK